MESRLKERLTGAAILVALIVLLVPEMFRGQHSDEAAPVSSGEGPPVRSYTIDLSNNPSSNVPLQPATESATPAAAAPAVTPAPAPAAARGPAPTQAQAPSSPPSQTHPVPVPEPSAAPVAAPRAAPAAPHAAGEWSVQLGLFAQHDNAERLLHSVQSKGFNAALTDRDAKGLYHVQIAHLSDRGAALAMQSRLREQGLAAAVIPPH